MLKVVLLILVAVGVFMQVQHTGVEPNQALCEETGGTWGATCACPKGTDWMSPTGCVENHGYKLTEHGFYVVNFLIFVLLLGYWLKKPAKQFLEKRRATAAQEMEEAAEVFSKAESRLQKYQGRLEGLAAEGAQMEADFRADGARQEAELLADGEATAARLKRDLELRDKQETLRVQDELQEELARQALDLADTKVRARMTPATHKALIKQYISDLRKTQELGNFGGARGGKA